VTDTDAEDDALTVRIGQRARTRRHDLRGPGRDVRDAGAHGDALGLGGEQRQMGEDVAGARSFRHPEGAVAERLEPASVDAYPFHRTCVERERPGSHPAERGAQRLVVGAHASRLRTEQSCVSIRTTISIGSPFRGGRDIASLPGVVATRRPT
jgi:hypothetical protein